jgi:hypothetical protein
VIFILCNSFERCCIDRDCQRGSTIGRLVRKNKLCFNNALCRNIHSIEMYIISLVFVWCSHTDNDIFFLELSLILSQNIENLCLHVVETLSPSPALVNSQEEEEGEVGGSGYDTSSSTNVWHRY